MQSEPPRKLLPVNHRVSSTVLDVDAKSAENLLASQMQVLPCESIVEGSTLEVSLCPDNLLHVCPVLPEGCMPIGNQVVALKRS